MEVVLWPGRLSGCGEDDDVSLGSWGLGTEVVGRGLSGLGLVTKRLTSQSHSC